MISTSFFIIVMDFVIENNYYRNVVFLKIK